MRALAKAYTQVDLPYRLLMATAAAVLLNGIYCLIYRYSKGNPATVIEAMSWGTIHLAPWIAAIEIGRSRQRWSELFGLLLAAGVLSLALESVIESTMPVWFDLVRRIPALGISVLALSAIHLLRKKQGKPEPELVSNDATVACGWARSAGNYIELHCAGHPVVLMRGTLAGFVRDRRPTMLRIHRRYAVLPAMVDRVERSHVKLTDGTRLPIGDRYRDQLSKIAK